LPSGEEQLVSPYSPVSHRTILVVDMADFSNPLRSSLHRSTMQNGLFEALQTAFGESGIKWEECEIMERGDGYLIFAPRNCSSGLFADRMPQRLLAALQRYNECHAVPAVIQLRVALHSGEVRKTDLGWDGDALNFIRRIIDAEPAKTELRDTRGVLATIVSERFFREVFEPDPATEPNAFRQIDVSVKRVRDRAWLRIQGTVPTLVGEPQPIPLVPDADVVELRVLLDDIVLPELPLLAARSTDHDITPIRTAATAWDVAQYLLDINSGPDAAPPLIVFLELLAARLGGELGAGLTRWNDVAQQRYPGIAGALHKLRESPPPVVDDDVPVHLAVMIDEDGADPERYYQVSHWRQDDPSQWPPPQGDTTVVRAVDIEYVVDRLVLDAEAAWVKHPGSVAIEFLLPRSLLHIPVTTWRKEYESGDPQPLALDYPVVVRSLERMRAQHWHRQWRNRWKVLRSAPAAATIHYAKGTEMTEPFQMEMRLRDPHVVAIVLSSAPQPDRPRDELTVALRAGLPIAIWVRDDASNSVDLDSLAAVVTHLVESGGLIELPRRVLQALRAALTGELPPHLTREAVHRLVILWDDADRLVYVNQPSVPRPNGDSAE
jgi:vWA-MoxR associated protein C-terminal domain/vWA-MoxR associated protein middle region 0